MSGLIETKELQVKTNYELQLEAWKKVIDVQQHFNDIEMRIRTLAITAVGAIFGAIGFIYENQIKYSLQGQEFPIERMLLVVAIIAVFGFWGMDRLWYHRLLIGAVKQGILLENEIEKTVPGIRLTKMIGEESAVVVFNRKIRSTNKLDLFYGMIISFLVFFLSLHFSNVVAIITGFLLSCIFLIWTSNLHKADT